jgi:carboxypeptidase Q
MKIFSRIFLLFFFPLLTGNAQVLDSVVIKEYQKTADDIKNTGLEQVRAYTYLKNLTSTIGGRLSGSPQAEKAVAWGKRMMEELGFQNVHLEPVMVPHWVRGSIEDLSFISPRLSHSRFHICALGGSIATPSEGITGEVIEVKSFDELKNIGEKAKGKIVFFNRPFDRTKFNTFEAYGGAVDQRGQGAVETARFGGVAALVRSMTSRIDDVPHTGAMHYVDTIAKIPAAAISTLGAEFIDSLLSAGVTVKLRLKLSCEKLPDVESANVVGELVGTEHPEEVIVVGGHLDSWDKGQGAHDDGAGVTQTLEALRILHDRGLQPKRTIRAVLFMNEENGLAGGKAYAAKERAGEKPIAALETDAGGFTPRGFGVQADSLLFDKIARWAFLLKNIDADRITKGGGGADISELGRKGVPMIGLNVDSQRYFDYHHSDSDTFDKVNERELELGAIAISILSYTIAQEGL